MELLADTFDKIRDAIRFVRENGTNTCNSETWKNHCEEYDLLETESYSIQEEIESLRTKVAELEQENANLLAAAAAPPVAWLYTFEKQNGDQDTDASMSYAVAKAFCKFGDPIPLSPTRPDRTADLESRLAKNNPLLDEAEDKIAAMENYVDDVCQVICDPYCWCDDIDVLRKIEKLLRDGSKLIGDK